jgi:hypothetical protein
VYAEAKCYVNERQREPQNLVRSGTNHEKVPFGPQSQPPSTSKRERSAESALACSSKCLEARLGNGSVGPVFIPTHEWREVLVHLSRQKGYSHPILRPSLTFRAVTRRYGGCILNGTNTNNSCGNCVPAQYEPRPRWHTGTKA